MNVCKTILAGTAAVSLALFSLTPSSSGQVWEGAQVIDANTGQNAQEPQVAVSNDGSGIAVFYQGLGGVDRAYANRWNGSAWSGAQIIDNGTANDAEDPRIAVDGSGKGIAVFSQLYNANDRIYANRWDGTQWTGASIIDNKTANNGGDQQIAMNKSGKGVAVFFQNDSVYDRVYANRWTGSAWTGATVIDAVTGNNASNPQVKLDSQGNAVAVFEQDDVTAGRIYARSWGGNSWSAPVKINANTGHGAKNPHVAVNPAGDAVAVFEQNDGTDSRVYANNRPSGGSWGVAVIIDSGEGYDPRVAVDEQGNAIAVFKQSDGTHDRIYANRWTGSMWSGATFIDSGPGNDAGEPQIAFDGQGNAFAVFRQSDGSHHRIYANCWTGSAWDGATLIDSGPGNDAGSPQIAFDGQGNAIAVFYVGPWGDQRIYANRYLAPTPTPTATPTATPVPPIDLTPNKTSFSSNDRIIVTADVQAISTPFFPFVRIVMANGNTLYYVRGEGFISAPAPYLRGGPFVLQNQITGYAVLDAAFSGIAAGTYYLEGGAVDATQTTSADNLVYIEPVDRETLTVQ